LTFHSKSTSSQSYTIKKEEILEAFRIPFNCHDQLINNPESKSIPAQDDKTRTVTANSQACTNNPYHKGIFLVRFRNHSRKAEEMKKKKTKPPPFH